MPLRPVVSVADGAVVLSLDVSAAGTVVGWALTNGLPESAVRLAAGAFLVRQNFPTGTYTGVIPKNRQWAVDADGDALYELTVRVG